MRRDTVFKREEPAKPVQFALAERGHVGPGVAVTNRTAERHEDHFQQRIVAAPIDPRIGNIFKMLVYLTDERSDHGFDLRARQPKHCPVSRRDLSSRVTHATIEPMVNARLPCLLQAVGS